MQYIPLGFSDTTMLILLNTYNDNEPQPTPWKNWSTIVYFNGNTGKVEDRDNLSSHLALIKGQWVEIRGRD